MRGTLTYNNTHSPWKPLSTLKLLLEVEYVNCTMHKSIFLFSYMDPQINESIPQFKVHDIIQPCGSLPLTLELMNCNMWAPQTNYYYSIKVYSFKLALENLGVILFQEALFISTIFTRNNTIHSLPIN